MVRPLALCVRRRGSDADLAGLVPLLAFSLGAGKPLRRQLKARDAAHQKRIEKQVARQADSGLSIPPKTAEHAAQAVADGLGVAQEKAL